MAFRISYYWPRLIIPLLLFVGAAGLSLTNVPSHGHVSGTWALSTGGPLSASLAFKEITKWIEFLAILLIVANGCALSSGCAVSAGCTSSAVASRRRSQAIVACLLIAGVGQAILGAYQFLTRSGPEFFAVGRFIRAYGTFEQPNPYGGYLGLVAPLGLALALGGPILAKRPVSALTADRGTLPAESPRSIPRWLKWLALGGFIASSVGIGMSASRGAWLAFGAAFVVVNVGRSRRSTALFLSLILAALLAGVLGGSRYLPVSISQRLTSFLPFVGAGDVRSIEITDANYASVERLAFWRAALDMWRDRPWLGIGFGNYQVAYPRFSLPKWRMALGHAHNYYLNVAAETGLIGLLAYLNLWGTALWQTVRAAHTASNPYRKALALGALGALVHISVHNIVDNLWVHNMYIHVAIVLGLVQSQFVSAEPRR